MIDGSFIFIVSQNPLGESTNQFFCSSDALGCMKTFSRYVSFKL